MIKANIILDSISPKGIRLVTFELIYPRFIHSEFLTHRLFSRNASSSRAIPVKKMIERIRKEPAMPIHWGQNQAGMQAEQEVQGEEKTKAIALWLEAAGQACDMAEKMLAFNLHKQVVNRITEPFAHIHVLVTATEWDNFFLLRDHKDAQPEIRELAIQMKKALENSIPNKLETGQWHLPFVREEEKTTQTIQDLLKISTARCARVSYLTHDGEIPNLVKDIELYDRLITSKPIHASPTEHQATPIISDGEWSGNFYGWEQHRKFIENNFNKGE